MKKKIILTSYIILSLLCACSKDTKKELKTNLGMNVQEIDLVSQEEANEELEKDSQNEMRQSEIKTNNKQITTNETKIETVKPNDENKNTEENKEEDNSVDANNIDYPIHKGRIDCNHEEECMEISLPIQFEFKQSIANTFYLEVISKSGNTLGYFIQYIFKDYDYQTEEECNKVGKKIKDTLSDRVVSYECNIGNLKINTDY